MLQARRSAVNVQASDNPARQMLSGLVSTIYKVSATMQAADAGASPMWSSLQKLDLAGVQNAIRAGEWGALIPVLLCILV